MTEETTPVERGPERDTVMNRHYITWHLKRGNRAPVAEIVCQAFPRDPCRQPGPWQHGFNLDDNSCWASGWIQSYGDADGTATLWAGAHDTHLTSGPINVGWDGEDWVWWYTDELRAPYDVVADLGFYEEDVAEVIARFVTGNDGTVDQTTGAALTEIAANTDDPKARYLIERVAEMSDPGENVAP